jgi:hypothetical protein
MLRILAFSVVSMFFLSLAAQVAPELTAKGNQLRFDSNEYAMKRLDVNNDGKPDIVSVFKKVQNEKTGETNLRIYVKMMDLNHDAKIDLWRFFNFETGTVLKEELDLDFDGKIDRTDYYIDGVVRRSEFDFQFDEKADVIKNFDEKGMLVEIDSDSDGDGKTDYWEFYKNGVIERIEKDNDGDGKSDVFKLPGDTGFTTIVDVDARFEIPEEKEAPAEEVKAEETQPEAPAAEETKADEVQPENKAE